MKHMLLVMNPYAGMRKANRVLADIIALFNRAGWDVRVHMTAGPGDGTRVVAQYAGQVDTVVCAGGDGTFNEMVTGLMRAGAPCPVGYIPCGSTNDFASSLHLPTDPLAAARQIASGFPVPYDIGRFGARYFSYVASFGAFTRASYATPQNVKNALGHLAYILAGFKELFQIPREHILLKTEDDTIEGDYIFGAISNSTSVGGIVTLDPKVVDMQDGRFELMLVRPPRDASEIVDLIQAVSTQRYESPMLTFRTVQRLRITAPPTMDWTLDGEREPGRAAPVEVENLHLAIRLLQSEGPA